MRNPIFVHRLQTAKMPHSLTSAQNNGARVENKRLKDVQAPSLLLD